MSFATAAMYMKGAGATNSVIGGFYGAASQKSSLELAADLDEINARISERAAQGELLRGEREYQASRLRAAALKSRQRVAMAANGIDLSEGTAVNVLASTDYIGEVDANEIRANAVKAAWGYRTQAANSMNSSTVRRASASGINPTMTAFSNALVAGADLATSYRGLKEKGAFDSDITAANKSTDPIASLGKSRSWWDS
jgi:hypothetical protein